MNDYAESIDIMQQLFDTDHQFTLSTMGQLMPSVRYVNTVYYEGSFYVVTDTETKKVREVVENPQVILNGNLYTFTCNAENIGHPLKTGNEKLREVLRAAFDWYDKHCDEKNLNACYLKITPTHGFFHHGGKGYDVDFKNKTAKIFPFDIETLIYTQTAGINNIL